MLAIRFMCDERLHILCIFIYQDLNLGGIGMKSPSEIKSSFLPVLRSGSCAEKGPKPSMEDLHICIDNLPQYLGEDADIPSPGAFYGVSGN